jgi:hypothetical protein
MRTRWFAISQSGTTTDTNRTVDLVRSRGAKVVAIVNRRGSDLTDKADGVLYTSDGRDVEMAWPPRPSTPDRGGPPRLAIASGGGDGRPMLRALRAADALEAWSAGRDNRQAAQLAPSERYWAVVGQRPQPHRAAEVRIKLSELCYKSIASDSTEDKKHIDLSSEPLIVVCAAGLEGSTADDVAKEVAIYRAHKASPVVIATDGQSRFAAALHVLPVPGPPALALRTRSAMAGHLFGYRRRWPSTDWPAPAEGRSGHRGVGVEAAATGAATTVLEPRRRPARRLAPTSSPSPAATSTASARAATTVQLDVHRRAAGASATRSASCRSTRTSWSWARSARRARLSRTSPPRSRRGSTS